MVTKFYQVLQRLAPNNKYKRSLLYLDWNGNHLLQALHMPCDAPGKPVSSAVGEWESGGLPVLFWLTKLSPTCPAYLTPISITLLSVYFSLDTRQQAQLFKAGDPRPFVSSFKNSWHSTELILKYVLSSVYYLPLRTNSSLAFS